MNPNQRIVIKTPLSKLWDDTGELVDNRIRYLDQNQIKELLRDGTVQFIVAEPGARLNWVPTQQRFDFWKSVCQQIAAPSKPIFLQEFPNEVAYSASEWRGRAGECLILLETHH